MRVLYLIPGMRGAGGAERSLAAMAPRLSEHVDLHVVTFTGRDQLRDDLESAGASLIDVGSGHRPALVRRLRSTIRRIEPDLVHTTLVDADIIGRLAAVASGVPVVSSLVNVNHGIDRLGRTPTTIAKRLGSWSADAVTARSVTRFHALTQHVASTMSKRLAIPRSRIEVIPRGRDPERLGRRTDARRSAARHGLGVDAATPLIIAAARHEEQKGLDVLIRSASYLLREFPDAQILIGGREGRFSSTLYGLVDTSPVGDRIRFIGQRDDLPELMCAADVWCVPSRWEGLGGILLEAMALEVPVVASDIPPIEEVAGTPSTMWLTPPDQPERLAATIGEVLRNPGEAHIRAVRARERFLTEFDIDAVADRMLGFYDTAAERTRWRHRR